MSLCCCTALFFPPVHSICCVTTTASLDHLMKGTGKKAWPLCVCVIVFTVSFVHRSSKKKKKTLIHSTPHCVNYSLTPCSLSIATSCSQVHSPANATQVLIQQVALISSFNLTIHTNGFSNEQSGKEFMFHVVWCHQAAS